MDAPIAAESSACCRSSKDAGEEWVA
jgi:hypothetical protein